MNAVAAVLTTSRDETLASPGRTKHVANDVFFPGYAATIDGAGFLPLIAIAGGQAVNLEANEEVAKRIASSLPEAELRNLALELLLAMVRRTGQCPEFIDILENWADTADLLSDTDALEELRSNMREAAEGKGVPWTGPETDHRSK